MSNPRTTARGALLVAFVALLGCSDTAGGPAFSQADLTGTWDRLMLLSNDVPGWSFQTITVSSTGAATFDACENQVGTCTVAGTVIYSIDATGNVTATGTAGNPTLHGAMNAAKELIVATVTAPSGTAYSLQVFRKRMPGVTYSSADVANLEFTFHLLQSGGSTAWARGTGSTDVSGVMSIATIESPLGPGSPSPSFDTMLVDADGLVTQVNDASFHGFMNAAKTAIFGVRTVTAVAPAVYALSVRLVTGGSFTQPALAGSWSYRMLSSGTSVGTSSWLRASASVDGSGVFTFSSAANPSGAVSIASLTLDLGSDGTLTRAGEPASLGQLALGGDLFVRTSTGVNSNGILSISAR